MVVVTPQNGGSIDVLNGLRNLADGFQWQCAGRIQGPVKSGEFGAETRKFSFGRFSLDLPIVLGK